MASALGSPNLILSPHFDDAVLSLGGFIAKSPDRAVVVTVFAGTPPDGTAGRWDRLSGFASAAAAMRVRCAENDAALAILGVSPDAIHNLGFLDRQYRVCETPISALQSRIGERIRRLVQDHGGAVNLFAPASAWHPDHRVVTDAAIDLVAAGMCPDTDVFLYQDQPYAYLELRKRSLLPLKFADFSILTDVAERRKALVPRPQFLDLEEWNSAAKMHAIEKYASQFPFIRHFLCKMIRDFARYQARAAGLTAHGVEVVYRLAPGSTDQS